MIAYRVLERLLITTKAISSDITIKEITLFVALLFFGIFTAFRTYTVTLERRRLSAFATAHNCAPPPTIPGSFLSGIMHKWKRLSQRGDIFNVYMNSMFVKHGPTHAVVSAITGTTKTLYTIQPENVKTMLSTKFSDYHRPRTMPNALDPVMGQGVFTSNGAEWAHSRALVRAQFSGKRVKDVAKLDRHMRNAFTALEQGEGTGPGEWTKEQEILLVLNRFTLDSATEFMFGTSTGSHELFMSERSEKFMAANGGGAEKKGWNRYKRILSDFATAFDLALDYVAFRLKLGRLWFLADSFAFRLACYKVQSYADNYIQEAVAHAAAAKAAYEQDGEKDFIALDDRKYGLISELVESYPDKVALRNQVLQVLVAGRDTTAASITWALILLDAHPDTFARLRDEITRMFGTESKPCLPVMYENLRSCALLQHVVFEVLRLYPTGPLNARKATVDTILPVGGGAHGKSPIAVPKGATVAFNSYLMHRWEECWGADSWEFNPDRWEGKRAGWEYIPFHGGPQTCLGRKF